VPCRALALSIACAALALAGCGKSNPQPASAVPSAQAGARAPGESAAREPFQGNGSARSQAKAFVAAVNLTAADVSPLQASHASHGRAGAREKQAEADLTLCFDAGGKRAAGASPLAEGASPAFEAHADGAVLSVSSNVTVGSNTGHEPAQVAALRSPRSRECLSRYLRALFAHGHRSSLAIKGISIQSGSPPAPGTAGGFGWRVTATVAGDGVKAHFYADILGFIAGRSEVTLVSTGFPLPFPAAGEERLFALLLSRATALHA